MLVQSLKSTATASIRRATLVSFRVTYPREMILRHKRAEQPIN
jgi:hypothetical protein